MNSVVKINSGKDMNRISMKYKFTSDMDELKINTIMTNQLGFSIHKIIEDRHRGKILLERRSILFNSCENKMCTLLLSERHDAEYRFCGLHSKMN